MRINLLTSFAAGIFLSAGICGAVYISGNNGTSKKSVKTNETQTSIKVQPSVNEMKIKLASSGYIVQTKAEYNKKLKDAAKSSQKTSNSSNKYGQKIVYRTFINVSNGMTSIDVGKMLINSKIITNKSAFQFSQDIQARKLENNLRPGTFEVDSSMSYDQIIATIFK